MFPTGEARYASSCCASYMSDQGTGQSSLTQPSPAGELVGTGGITEQLATEFKLIARQKTSYFLEIAPEKHVGSWRCRGY